MRFILRYQGRGSPPAQDLARIRSLPELHIVDESSPRMLLVEGVPSAFEQLKAMPSWVVSEEKMLPLPKQRPEIRSS